MDIARVLNIVSDIVVFKENFYVVLVSFQDCDIDMTTFVEIRSANPSRIKTTVLRCL
jgi:hypothetical protein